MSVKICTIVYSTLYFIHVNFKYVFQASEDSVRKCLTLLKGRVASEGFFVHSVPSKECSLFFFWANIFCFCRRVACVNWCIKRRRQNTLGVFSTVYVRLFTVCAFSMREEIHLSYFGTIHVNQTAVNPPILNTLRWNIFGVFSEFD